MLYEVVEQATLTYNRSRVQQDAEGLIKKHGQLVRRIAWHVHSRMSTAIEVADLIQIGMIALVEAARTFEERGIAFAPYATMRIRGSMIDQLRRDARMCRSGMAHRRKLVSTRAALESVLHRRATDTEMATELAIDLKEYHLMSQAAQAVQQDSLDEVYSDHEPWFADNTQGAEDSIHQKQLKDALAANIERLSAREATILQLYFVEEVNLDEIGEAMNVGAARICQIKKSALEKLRVMMADWSPV
jgi:RNA polymerase sigma factor FliA